MIHHIKKVHLICPLNSDLDLFRLLHVNWNCFFFLNYLNYLIHVRDYLEQEVAVLTWMVFFIILIRLSKMIVIVLQWKKCTD